MCRVKLRLRLLYCPVVIVTRNTQNGSSAFDPSGLAPVEHAHAQGHTLMETYTLEQWAAIHSTRGAWGYGASLKGTSVVEPISSTTRSLQHRARPESSVCVSFERTKSTKLKHVFGVFVQEIRAEQNIYHHKVLSILSFETNGSTGISTDLQSWE